MRRIFLLYAVMILLAASPASAHRLDEYLQATTIAIAQNRVELQMRLTPGVQVLNQVLPAIDSNGDGILSQVEEQHYAEAVIRDLVLKIDDQSVKLRLVSFTFPELDEMKDGLGDIVLKLDADFPGHVGADRKLTFENHHLNGISVYLVNCLVPADPGIHITGQDRNYTQSTYQLDFKMPGELPPVAGPGILSWWDKSGSTSLFKAFFYHGIHHILTGYDHLLFVSALVLAAASLWELVKVVTAFTVAHTITLTLAAFNVISLPEWIVEPLISASIVFVALQNVIWPGRATGWSRLGAAFFFGLFHGLGFAGGLLEAMREMQTGTMLLALLAFSIGIEVGHQMVVLPLFGFLKLARNSQPDSESQIHLAMKFQRLGSVAISIAGGYYLCLALTSPA